MRLTFAYDIEKDAQNYQVGVRSLNNKRPTKRQTQYMERYGFGDWVASGRLSAMQCNDVKESLTVLLNSEFLDLMEGDTDLGYPQHQELRAIIQRTWTRTKDIDQVFALAAEYRLLQKP